MPDPRVPVTRGFGIQPNGANAGWRGRSEHFRAGGGTFSWVAFNWDKVHGGSGRGRCPARIIRSYQMPGDAFGQYRMYVEAVWCLNYLQLLSVDPDLDEKLPPELVEMMKKDGRIYLESNWKQLLEFESVVTDAEVNRVLETVFASQQPLPQRMQVAACEPGDVGVWNGEWEECTILNTHDRTFDLRILSDGEVCLGVPHRHLRGIYQVAQCGPGHNGRRSPQSRTERTHHSPSPLTTHHSPLNLHPRHNPRHNPRPHPRPLAKQGEAYGPGQP